MAGAAISSSSHTARPFILTHSLSLSTSLLLPLSLSLSLSLSPWPLPSDRVVDELQPERHFTTDEIITLMRPLAPLPAPQDFSYSASNFLYDQILMILCKHFGPLLTKVCLIGVGRFRLPAHMTHCCHLSLPSSLTHSLLPFLPSYLSCHSDTSLCCWTRPMRR